MVMGGLLLMNTSYPSFNRIAGRLGLEGTSGGHLVALGDRRVTLPSIFPLTLQQCIPPCSQST